MNSSSNEVIPATFPQEEHIFFRWSRKQIPRQPLFAGFARMVAGCQLCRWHRSGEVFRAFNQVPLSPAVKDAWLRASQHNCNCKPYRLLDNEDAITARQSKTAGVLRTAELSRRKAPERALSPPLKAASRAVTAPCLPLH